MLFGRFLIIEGGCYFVYEYMLNCCLVSYMVYRWPFSDPMLCLESLQLFFIGLISDLQAVVFEDFTHFFFDCFYLLGRFCAGF